MAKYLIIKTTPTNVRTGGRFLVSADNILSITTDTYVRIIYAGGIVVQINFITPAIKTGDDGVATYFTQMVRSLQESSNATLEIPNIIPNSFDNVGNPIKVQDITTCLFTTACVP